MAKMITSFIFFSRFICGFFTPHSLLNADLQKNAYQKRYTNVFVTN